jgi:hypothetical protein
MSKQDEIEHYKNRLNIQINEYIELRKKCDRLDYQLDLTEMENVELRDNLQAYKYAVKYLTEQVEYWEKEARDE